MTRGASIRTLVFGFIAVAMLVGTGVFVFWPREDVQADTLGDALPEFGPMPEHGPLGELPPRPELDFARVPDTPRVRALPGGLPNPPEGIASSTDLARLYLESVRGHLATVEPARRAVLLRALLERGVDAPLAGAFDTGEDGFLRSWPSLRLAWLDLLGREDPDGVAADHLADLATLAACGAPASAAAAGRALVALARREPATVFAALERDPALLARAPRVRAAVFAAANRDDAAQRAAVDAYLRRTDLSPEERAAFARAAPPEASRETPQP